MRYVVKFRGDLVREVDSLVDGFIAIRDEFKLRWPRAIYGQQEAAAHGFTLAGTPELTPEEARDLRADLHGERDYFDLRAEIAKQRCDAQNLGAALRPGVIQ